MGVGWFAKSFSCQTQLQLRLSWGFEKNSDKNSLCYDLIVLGVKVASLIFKLVKVILSQRDDD